MEERCWSAGVFTLRQLVARPCHLVSMTSSSLVSMTMSRQLPTLHGLKGRDLCATDSPAMETTDNLFLVVPPEAFSQITGVALDADVKSESLWGVVKAGLLSWLLLLWVQDARLSLDKNSCCRVRGAESSRMVSSEQLLVRGLAETTVLRLIQLPPN